MSKRPCCPQSVVSSLHCIAIGGSLLICAASSARRIGSSRADLQHAQSRFIYWPRRTRRALSTVGMELRVRSASAMHCNETWRILSNLANVGSETEPFGPRRIFPERLRNSTFFGGIKNFRSVAAILSSKHALGPFPVLGLAHETLSRATLSRASLFRETLSLFRQMA